MTRQRYGTGSMVERGPGVWRLRAYIREDARQVQRTFHGDRRAAARELAKLVAEVEQGRFDHTKATVRELLDAWLEHIGTTRAPTTIRNYRWKIDKNIGPAIGDVPLAKLRPETLDHWYRLWLNQGLATATVRAHHAIISAACQQALKWGWITANPAGRASPPTVRTPALVVPSVEEVEKLYRAARDFDPVLGTAVALAAVTGARRGELCALRWSDVDLSIGRVSITRSLSVVDGVTHEGPTKTHQRRDIALDGVGVAALADRWAYQLDLSERADSPLVADPFVLSYQAHSGTPASPDTISHRFATIANAAGVKCHLHSLRHFSVTTLIAAGVDIRTVAERHGHAQATMTMNVYAHALPERDRAAAGILGRALGGGQRYRTNRSFGDRLDAKPSEFGGLNRRHLATSRAAARPVLVTPLPDPRNLDYGQVATSRAEDNVAVAYVGPRGPSAASRTPDYDHPRINRKLGLLFDRWSHAARISKL